MDKRIRRVEIVVITVEDENEFKKYKVFFKKKFPELSKRVNFFNSIQKAIDFMHEDSLHRMECIKRKYEMHIIDIPKEIESLPREMIRSDSYVTIFHHHKIN